MLQLVKMGGPGTIPVLAIGGITLLCALVAVMGRLFGMTPSRGGLSLRALPFLGAAGLLLGLIATGECLVRYRSLNKHGVVAPAAVSQGYLECSVAALIGLAIMLFALLFWRAVLAWQHFAVQPAHRLLVVRIRLLDRFIARYRAVPRTARLAFLLGSTGLLVALYPTVYRPWSLSWGSTTEEQQRSMPGDELVADPNFNATRAVTIDSPPEQIWPWLIQMGYQRAGFYSWDALDNDGVPSAEQILQPYQLLSVGDSVPLSAQLHSEVRLLEPNRFLLLVTPQWGSRTGMWTWVWGLYPVDTQRTRLVSRLRVRSASWRTSFMLDNLEIIMMRKCLLGIKRRAEAASGG